MGTTRARVRVRVSVSINHDWVNAHANYVGTDHDRNPCVYASRPLIRWGEVSAAPSSTFSRDLQRAAFGAGGTPETASRSSMLEERESSGTYCARMPRPRYMLTILNTDRLSSAFVHGHVYADMGNASSEVSSKLKCFL